MRIDNNAEALAMMKRALGSLEGKFREIYNKGFHDGRKEGMNLVKREIAYKILGEIEDDPNSSENPNNSTISMEQAGKEHGMWVKDRNPNEKEFIENYVRNHHGAEFVVMIKNADRPTTLYYTSDGYWIDDSGNFYDVIAWMPLPEPYKESE